MQTVCSYDSDKFIKTVLQRITVTQAAAKKIIVYKNNGIFAKNLKIAYKQYCFFWLTKHINTGVGSFQANGQTQSEIDGKNSTSVCDDKHALKSGKITQK